MLALFMDSSTDNFNLALLSNGKVVYAKRRRSEKNMTEFAVDEVAQALSATNCCTNDLTDIYVTTGPGSFTSVRIALVIAKTIISQHRQIRLWSASSLEFQLGNREGISLINARSGNWYVALRANGKTKTYDHVLNEGELQNVLQQNPRTPVWRDLEESGILENLPERMMVFKRADDYKKVIATYIKPAYGK